MTFAIPNILAESSPLEHVVNHALVVNPDGWWLLSNHMVMLGVGGLLMLLIFLPITAKYRSNSHLVPTGTRNMVEAILLYLRNDVVKPVLGDSTDTYMPLLWTLFFFVWVVNLLGLMPLDVITGGVFGWNHGHGIYGTATANLWVTGVLAVVTFIVVQATGIYNNGLGGYLKHFAGPPGLPLPVVFLMIPVEFIGLLVKPFALMIRLFANMTAGHVLLAVLAGFVILVGKSFGYTGSVVMGVPVVLASVAVMCLELFVATLQAYIFMFLTALFVSQMLGHAGDDHEHHADGHVHAGGSH